MNMRPGVFTEHTISKLANPYKAKSIAIIGKGGAPLVLKKITTRAEAMAAFPAGTNALMMVETVQAKLQCDLYVVGIGEQDATAASYKTALDIVLDKPEPYCIITDFESSELTEYARDKLSECKTAKLFISGCSSQADPSAYAKSINSERICLTAPKVSQTGSPVDLSPLILAIIITKGDNISNNFASELINGDFAINTELSEVNKNDYLYNGISVFETMVDSIMLIRGMTSKTLDSNGNYDCTYRNICVILAADTVKSTLNDMLSLRLNGKNPASSLGAIMSLVVCELVNLTDKGLISSYDKPVIALLSTDNSICKISVNVTISQGINQIYLHLNMNV